MTLGKFTDAEPSAPQERWDLGPWENGYRQIWTPSGLPFQAGVVAHVFGDMRRQRLVCAAPDLLAALTAMVDAECEYMRLNNLGDPEKQHNVKLARAAIAKATGVGQ